MTVPLLWYALIFCGNRNTTPLRYTHGIYHCEEGYHRTRKRDETKRQCVSLHRQCACLGGSGRGRRESAGSGWQFLELLLNIARFLSRSRLLSQPHCIHWHTPSLNPHHTTFTALILICISVFVLKACHLPARTLHDHVPHLFQCL